jgi:phosphate transport system protein
MIIEVLDAFIARDIDAADDIRLRDEEVDLMHNTMFRELLTYMMEDPSNISACMHLLFIAKNIERAGDHTVQIAEQVHYLVSGSMPEDRRPKGDKTSTMVISADKKKRT